MSIMMAVDLLGCTGNTEERAALLHKTIQLAAELKSSLGNMFGFAAVMRALELPQVGPEAPATVSRGGDPPTPVHSLTLCLSDFPPGADVGDVTPATHRGRYSVREEAQAFLKEHKRWER